MNNCEIIENFHGVYLLCCLNPKYKRRTYIGYTRDPNRRIKQHNRGTWAGGAGRTSNRGPWKMVLIVHGFPNNISALRFEWAWQNPTRTTRLHHVPNLKKIPRKETEYQFQIRILLEMLRVGPWCRLPLSVRWLEKDFYEEFPTARTPPSHIKICHGPIKTRNVRKKLAQSNATESRSECLLCSNYIRDRSKLSCLNANCDLVCHLTCLADLFLLPGDYVPIEGECPFCGTHLKWGDLIRKLNGCGDGIVEKGGDVDMEISDEETCSQADEFMDNNSYCLDDCDDGVL